MKQMKMMNMSFIFYVFIWGGLQSPHGSTQIWCFNFCIFCLFRGRQSLSPFHCVEFCFNGWSSFSTSAMSRHFFLQYFNFFLKFRIKILHKLKMHIKSDEFEMRHRRHLIPLFSVFSPFSNLHFLCCYFSTSCLQKDLKWPDWHHIALSFLHINEAHMIGKRDASHGVLLFSSLLSPPALLWCISSSRPPTLSRCCGRVVWGLSELNKWVLGFRRVVI